MGFRWHVVCGFWFDLLCMIAVSGLCGWFGFGFRWYCAWVLVGSDCLIAVDL